MADLSVVFKEQNGGHLYRQIYDYIVDEIRSGRLQAEEKLPSTRQFAENLQVSRSTVDLAYEQLLSEGYIESRPYRGYYVCKVEELYRTPGQESTTADPKTRESVPMPEGTIDFSPNGVDMELFPFSIWRRINREVLGDGKNDLFALGEPQGERRLRESICRYLHSSRSVQAEPDQIIVGAGNDYLLMLLGHILKDGKTAFEAYSYRRAYRIFSTFSETVTVPMDANGICVDALEACGANIAYVMPTHQYPTGSIMPIGRRTELLNWAAGAPGRYIVEDDYDSEFRYRGRPVPALQGVDKAGRVIYIGSFSKSIAPAIRVSFMVLPLSLLERYRETCGFYASTVSRIDQNVLSEFLESGAFERHLNRMRKAYREKHDVLLEELRCLKGRYTINGENSGLHVVLTKKDKNKEMTPEEVRIEEQRIITIAAAAGVHIYGMQDTALTGPISHTQAQMMTMPSYLIGYAGLDAKQIREGVRKLEKIL